MKNRQSGIAHIIIIIAAVVAIVGILGFVLWQNVFNHAATTADSSTTTPSTTDASSVSTTSSTITVPEWNIKGPSSGVVGIKYKIATINGVEYLVFTTPTLEADANCNAGYTGTIARYAGTDTANIGAGVGSAETTAAQAYDDMTVPNNSYAAKARIGDYYYFLLKPQGSCADTGSSIETEVIATYNATDQFILHAESTN